MLIYVCYWLLFYMNKAKTIGMIAAIMAIAGITAIAIAPAPVAHAQNTNGDVCTAGGSNEFCAFNANQDNEDSFHDITFPQEEAAGG